MLSIRKYRWHVCLIPHDNGNPGCESLAPRRGELIQMSPITAIQVKKIGVPNFGADSNHSFGAFKAEDQQDILARSDI